MMRRRAPTLSTVTRCIPAICALTVLLALGSAKADTQRASLTADSTVASEECAAPRYPGADPEMPLPSMEDLQIQRNLREERTLLALRLSTGATGTQPILSTQEGVLAVCRCQALFGASRIA